MKFKHLGRKKIFENSHITVISEELELPNHTIVNWTFTQGRHYVGILALTPENNVVLVKQYRPALKNMTVEIPAGLVELGEEPEVAALRELQEETGYHAQKITKIYDYYTSPGFTDSQFHIYLAEELVMKEQHLDPEEFIEVIEIPWDNIPKECYRDSKSLIALNYLKNICK